MQWRFLRSFQFKCMLGMVLVSLASMLILGWTYDTWIKTAAEQLMHDRLNKALMAFPQFTDNLNANQSQLVLLARRYNLSGAGLYDAQNHKVVCAIGSPADPEALRKFAGALYSDAEGATNLVAADSGGGKILWGARRLARNGHEYLFVVAIAQDQELFRNDSFSAILYLSLIGSVLLAALLSYLLLTNTVARPVRFISQAMAEVAGGNYQRHLQLKVDLELEELVLSFNRMAEMLQASRREVQEYQQSLQDKIAQIKADLEAKENALIQAAKLASLGELAAGVAHEINNPLYHIMLSAGLLLEDATDPAARQRLEKLITQAKRCRRIVSDLLEYARGEGAAMEPFNLGELLEECLLDLRQHDLPDEIEVSQHWPAELPPIRGSMREIKRVFNGVLRNAVQAMTGPGKLTVEVDDSQHHKLKVVISDTGVGMSEETLARALDPFFTTKEVGQGTGLGLAIAYGIITRHGGQLSLSSELGRGTRVTITLPLTRGESAKPAGSQP